MSHRPIAIKKANRLRKALRNTPDIYVDLIEYMVSRRLVKTKREARHKLIDGKVMAGSHKIGRREIDNLLKPNGKEWVADPYVPANLKRELVVLS